jgi:putative Holliday junction resolvase
MCLDIGTKRIGIALSDYLHILAKGECWVPRIPEDEAISKIKELAKSNNVETIVIGIPINMDGSQGFQAEDCKSFANNFSEFDLKFEDERLTSDLAEENLRERKIDFRKNKYLVDIESARIILEQYLGK